MAKDKINTEENFFQRLISMFLGNSDPEAEKKRLLKATAKELSHSKYKFYKYSSDEALPQLAKFFYDIYKIIAPAQAMIQGIQNPNAIKNAVINHALTENQHELASKLTEESILEQAKTVPINQLSEQIKTNLSTFITDFDTEKIQQIDKLYSKIAAFKEFCSFDYFFLLKKFDSGLKERDFNYIPKFDTIRAEYISDDLIDFTEVAWALPFTEDWTPVMQLFKSLKGVEPVQAVAWNKLMIRLRNLRDSKVFEMIIKLITKNPVYKQSININQEQIFEPYIEKIRNQTTQTLKKIEQAKTNSKVEEILKNLFGSTNVTRLKNYNENANTVYAKKNITGYLHYQPMNYMKAFLIDFFKKDIREYTDLVLVRGKWVSSALSNQLSDTYHAILTVSDQISDFDNSLSDDTELGIKLKNLLIRCDRDKDSARYIRTQLGDINDKALSILTMGSQQLVTFARELKNLIEDTEKSKPQLLINWKELEHYSEKPIKEMGVNIYKMIYNFVTLMQLFLKK